MDNEKKLLFSPLFLKYQEDFEKNPKSRVFAPLAEIYRKVGMTEKAMEVLSQGLRYHPAYVIGYLGLAFCYYDIRQYNLAYSTLKPFIDENRDNLRMQKLFSDICLALFKKDEALQTLKYLLFLNAKDKEVAAAVMELEQEMESAAVNKHVPIIIPEEPEDISALNEPTFQIEKLETAPKENFDDWMTVNLKTENQQNSEQENSNDSKHNIEWHVDEEEAVEPSIIDTTPVVTHTLVDLYCSQGHLEKAIEILEKILILNPSDQRTIAKKNEIMALVAPPEVEKPQLLKFEKIQLAEEVSEEDGRKQLMDFIDEHIHVEVADVEEKRDTAKLEKKYQLFLKKIQKRALDYQTRI
jgi:tetratricopeptide (TPR) repeat protein